MAHRCLADGWCCVALGLALAVGCGGRSDFTTGLGLGTESDTFVDTETETDTVTGGEAREGSCDNPIELPFAAQTVRGRLVGGGRAGGWCGGEDGDLGREDSYLLTPPYTSDVILTMREGTDFAAILRVTRDSCYEEADIVPAICTVPEIDAPWHFLAEVGHTYNITVDSSTGTDGRYVLDVALGWPPLEACPIHPSTITAEPAGYFQWANDLGRGQGQVDGFCGGPGRENMFRVVVNEPAFMVAVVNYEGMQPVVNVRSSCAAVSEIVCDTAPTTSGQIELDYFFDTPGEYYFVIDQRGIEGGSYALEVFF